jgi:hypothetical protein
LQSPPDQQDKTARPSFRRRVAQVVLIMDHLSGLCDDWRCGNAGNELQSG